MKDDLIYRQAVLAGFEKYSGGSFAYGCVWDYVKKLPSVTPQETVTEFADRCRECGAKYGKLLRQESVLDEIRAEIEKLEYLNIDDGSDGYDKYIEQYEVLKIIDKYKAESEGKG